MINVHGYKIDTFSNNIGILCSGGADSAILLYILLKFTKNPIYVFTLGSRQKNNINIKVANNVIKKCQELSSRTIAENVIQECDIQTREQVFNKNFIEYIDNGTIEVLYTGFTSNPPKSVTDTFSDTTELKLRDPLKDKPLYYRNRTIYTPFGNIDKKQIAELYKNCDVLDSLFPITRSCEWHSDMGGKDPGLGHCGRCWWCEERIWAFSELI